jgi:hypothetical protein
VDLVADDGGVHGCAKADEDAQCFNGEECPDEGAGHG